MHVEAEKRHEGTRRSEILFFGHGKRAPCLPVIEAGFDVPQSCGYLASSEGFKMMSFGAILLIPSLSSSSVP